MIEKCLLEKFSLSPSLPSFSNRKHNFYYHLSFWFHSYGMVQGGKLEFVPYLYPLPLISLNTNRKQSYLPIPFLKFFHG